MNFVIKKMTLTNFKGITHKEFDFSKTNEIVGENGSGKTTFETAYFWLFSDCDSELRSNPSVFPLNISDVTPKVEVIADFDGKVVEISRVVKRSVKASKVAGTGDAVSFSSTYTVNAVEYGLRDFKKKLEEYGFSDERFLTLSHPESFLSEKKDVMRKLLFGMVSNVTDLEIARGMSGVDNAAELLEKYTFDEAAAIQNSTLRKIREIYGKSGEILRAKIEGLNMSKIELDFAELELQRNLIKENLDKNASALNIAKSFSEDLAKARENCMKLEFEINGITQKENAEKIALESKQNEQRWQNEEKLSAINRDIAKWENELDIYDSAFKRGDNEVKTYEAKIKDIQAQTFNDNSLYCPTCNQLFKLDRQEQIKKDFEADRTIKINMLNEQIKEAKSLLTIKHAERSEIVRKLEQAKIDKAELETLVKQPINASESNYVSPYAETKSNLESKLAEVKKEVEIKSASMPDVTSLNAEKTNLESELKEVEIKLSKSEDNNRIDQEVEKLQKEQMEYEQAIADCEKVLYELSLIQKTKNAKLTESINKHFKIVNFCFWEFLKNGEYRECCKIYCQNKELGASLNTAMQIQAKLDVIQGLQNFYNEFYPVWLDQGEALDDNSKSQIDMPCQMVYLTVTNDKGLSIMEV